MKTDISDLRERITAESQQYLSLPPGEDEFTVYHLMEWHGIEINSAGRVLKKMMADGKVTKRKGKYNGGSCNIYKEVE